MLKFVFMRRGCSVWSFKIIVASKTRLSAKKENEVFHFARVTLNKVHSQREKVSMQRKLIIQYFNFIMMEFP